MREGDAIPPNGIPSLRLVSRGSPSRRERAREAASRKAARPVLDWDEFSAARRMAIFKTCSATRTEFLRGARFRKWRMSRRKRRSALPVGAGSQVPLVYLRLTTRPIPARSQASAVRSVDPFTRDATNAPNTQSRALRGARFLRVWPLKIRVDAQRNRRAALSRHEPNCAGSR